jgi:AcrR family transcriptional regulator
VPLTCRRTIITTRAIAMMAPRMNTQRRVRLGAPREWLSSVTGERDGSTIWGSLLGFFGEHELIETWCPVQIQRVSTPVVPYTSTVPKLWTETIEAHRREVRDAILDSTAALVVEHGLLSVTMSQIAEETGIGRATLYKYFADVEAILRAWHQRQITGHLRNLVEARDQAGDAGGRLEAVLEAYAFISHDSRGHHDTELAAFLHRDNQVTRAQRQLRDMIQDLVAEGVKAGDLRGDVAPDELASYCLHALTAATSLPSKDAVSRLVAVTLAGLRRPS